MGGGSPGWLPADGASPRSKAVVANNADFDASHPANSKAAAHASTNRGITVRILMYSLAFISGLAFC